MVGCGFVKGSWEEELEWDLIAIKKAVVPQDSILTPAFFLFLHIPLG